MRGHGVKQSCPHQHTKADVLWVCCRKMLDELIDDTTPQGIKDAEECAERAFLEHPEFARWHILGGKIYSILDSFLENVKDMR